MNNIKIISKEIDYFEEIFFFIEDIKHMNSPSESQITEIINLIKNKDETIKKETCYYLKKGLSETIFKESSLIFRYILKTIYNYDYSNINDCKIINSAFDNLEESNLNYFNDDYNIELDLNKILNNDEITIKTIGNFFDKYCTTYEFDKNKSKQLFESLINYNNKITKLNLILIQFPEYEEIFNNIYDEILKDETIYLTIPERLYLGIIASNSIGCDFLTKELIQNFIINGGKKDWIIKGLDGAPEEFKKISKINNILMYQPWILNQNYLNESGFSTKIEKFIQICIILISFGRLANIILSFKFIIQNPDEINNNIHKINNQNLNKNKSNTLSKIYKVLKNCDNSKERRQIQSQLISLYNKEKQQNNSNKNEIKINKDRIYSEFFNDCNIQYQDFNYHEYEFISNYEYNFETSIFYQLQDYWPNVMNLIKKEYIYICDLTSYCVGNGEKIKSVEYFRRAIITYVEKLFGFYDETFDYSKTNKLLIISLKDFIKNSVCYPNQVNYDYVYSIEYNIPDLIHTILLSTAVKEKVQLSYLALLFNK